MSKYFHIYKTCLVAFKEEEDSTLRTRSLTSYIVLVALRPRENPHLLYIQNYTRRYYMYCLGILECSLELYIINEK